jgi:hypothetical protein
MHVCQTIYYIWWENQPTFMKFLKLIFLLAVAGTALQCRQPEKVNPTQTTIFDKQEIVLFNLKYGTDTTSVDDIEWTKEQLESEFELKGRNTLRYRIKLINDSIGELWQYRSGSWNLQEQLAFSSWTIRRVDVNKLYSEFCLTDFNQDGNTDLTFCHASNINGNNWTKVFLNDGNRLVSLYNDAEGSYIWDDPQYNAKTKTINTELYSSAYGIQNTASYKLTGLTATPIKKEESDLTHEEKVTVTTYKGVQGNWKLVKTETEKLPVE